MKKWTQKWTTPLRLLLVGAGISAAALLVPMVVSAVPPAANTVIGNQAAATYVDASGKPQTASSNLVSTTVAQVAGVTLSDGVTKTAIAGNTVYAPHTLTNDGNGTDSFRITVKDTPTEAATFTNIAIYADPNGTGTASGQPLCSGSTSGSTPPPCTESFLQSVPALGKFNFVVAYTVPSNATTPLSPAIYDSANVKATSVFDPAVNSGDKLDKVLLTKGAVFSSTKAIALPATAAPSALTTGWPTAVTSGKASPAACSDPTTPLSTIAGVNARATNNCTYTVYTITYDNVGGDVGAFYVEDTLPSGMTFVPGTAVWSGTGAAALATPAVLSTTPTGTGINAAFTTGKFKADIASVAVNGHGAISFIVMINSTAVAGTSSTNNVAAYSTATCDLACSTSTTPTTTPTNPSPFPVSPTFKAIAANLPTVLTTDGATPLETDTQASNPDLVVAVGTQFLGTKVPFIDYVINKGNVTDTFNVAVDTNDYPAGTTFAFFKQDGVTPLTDTNGDGKVDTGPIAPDSNVKFVIVVTLPNTATAAELASKPFDAKVVATSVGDPTVKDSVWDRIAAITPAKVDLTNTPDGNRTVTNGTPSSTQNCTAGTNCDLGQGPSSQPTDTETVQPGATATFPIYVTNTSGAPTDFKLTASVPPGWDVKFTTAATCAAPIAAVDTITSLPSATTGPTAPIGTNEQKVLACVTPPAGTTPGTTPITFTATKSVAGVLDPTTADTLTDAVTVTAPKVPGMQLGPNTGVTTSAPGGTVVQPVTILNTGTTSCGAGTGANAGFNVSVALDSAAVTAGWTAVVYYDVTGKGIIDSNALVIDAGQAVTVANLTASNPLAGNSALIPLLPAPGNTKGLPLLVKLFAPSGAVKDSTATATLTVTDLNTDATAKCPTQAAAYTSKIVNGQLRVIKTQALDELCNNTGAITAPDTTRAVTFQEAPLKVTPGQCLIYKVVASNDGSAPVTSVLIKDAAPAYTTYWATPAGTCTVSGGTGTTISAFATAGVSCDGGSVGITLNPQGSMTVQFSVKVDN